jgi:hypothetical protein
VSCLRESVLQTVRRVMSSAIRTGAVLVAQNNDRLLRGLAQTGRVILVGLGNIGSRLAMELPLAGARKVLLVDPDRVSCRNLRTCWAFNPNSIGQPKVDIVVQQVRRSFPQVSAEAAPCLFNRLGLARLRDWSPAVLVGAVDSRHARYELAEAAIWLGMPLIDLGIPAAGPPAARVQVTWWPMQAIDPLNAWSALDWSLLEQPQPCGSPSADQEDRPLASSVSGAVAASLGAAALRKLLSYDTSDNCGSIVIGASPSHLNSNSMV